MYYWCWIYIEAIAHDTEQVRKYMLPFSSHSNKKIIFGCWLFRKYNNEIACYCYLNNRNMIHILLVEN